MFEHPKELQQRLEKALKNKGDDYRPRTRYLDQHKKPVYINRLILEDSPYLLQHAHNPVNWFAWGDEAFNIAGEENKPVFLSIGYSTCHWCHVMEEESFDNEDTAKIMNKLFVCVKVDRELHPDVDTFYMTAVMMMQGQGGWPMSSFLTANRKPFFGGTYFQPAPFITLMTQVNNAWQSRRDELLQQANAISRHVAEAMAAKHCVKEVGTNVVEMTARSIMDHYDPQFGGFGQAPKFPNEPYLYFLLEYASYSGAGEVMDAVINTLHIQSCGGLYDQLAGGFHRYATDRNWLVPHFEKMLYNQANLSCVFVRAFQLTGIRDFKRVACETLDYVLREMSNEQGAFYSATDADSEGKEGLFFVWDIDEINTLLNDGDANKFIELYQITEAGNFEGKNIPNLNQPLTEYAEKNNYDYDELIERLGKIKKTLWQARAKRIPPLRDDKVITAWNGMMIKAFAFSGQGLQRQDYIDAAIKAAHAVLKFNKTDNDLLSRSSLNGQAAIPGLQEDYAYMAEALLQLYDTTLDRQWLKHASTLTDAMIDGFWDDENGGFLMSRQGEVGLLPTTPKEINDNATSSGNSVALRTLLRLARRTGTKRYQTYAQKLISAYADDITRRPYSCSYLMCGLLEMFAGEQSSQQWCADGNILVTSTCEKENDNYQLTLDIAIDQAWHLNQIQDGDNNPAPLSIATTEAWVLKKIIYPQAISKTLGFQAKPVKVYTGSISITLELSNPGGDQLVFSDRILKLRLGLQACNMHKCLAPETITLVLFHTNSV